MFLPVAFSLLSVVLAVSMDDQAITITKKWSKFLDALEAPDEGSGSPKALVEEKVTLGEKKKIVLHLGTVVSRQRLEWKLEKTEPEWLQVRKLDAPKGDDQQPPKAGRDSGSFEIEPKQGADGAGTATFQLRFSTPYKNKKGQEFKEVRYRLKVSVK
jgi:hypothetical protein